MDTPEHPVPALPDLLRMQALAVECLYSCAMEINSSARSESEGMRVLWAQLRAHWTDAEGQRVGEWIAELDYADQQTTRRSQFAARGKCCYRIWRLLQRRLARRLNYDWPEGGMMLKMPSRGRRATDRTATVDSCPVRPVAVTPTGPDSP